MTRNKVAELSK